MKILVCISCVPDTTSKINFTNNDTDFDTNGVQFVINPNDEFGLTRAMWFKEKNNASIDVINVGEQSNETVLRKALAIGADRAIRIDSKAIDSYQVAKNISNFIKEKSYDLIIAGRESIDYNGSMVPGMISEILNINGLNIKLGSLDITFHRDDYRERLVMPEVRGTDIQFRIDNKVVILIDDVLFTGRTVRASLDELNSFGRSSGSKPRALITMSDSNL